MNCLLHENSDGVANSEDTNESEPPPVKVKVAQRPVVIQLLEGRSFPTLLPTQSEQSNEQSLAHLTHTQTPPSQGSLVHMQSSEAWQFDLPIVSDSFLGLGVIAGGVSVLLACFSPWLRSVRSQLLRHKRLKLQKSVERVCSEESGSIGGVDPLTGLLNRTHLISVGARILSNVSTQQNEPSDEMADRSDVRLTLLCINVNQFSTVNIEMGYEAGDELLRQLSSQFRAVVRSLRMSAATLARISGDEFALLLVNADSAEIQQLSADLLKALSRPAVVQDQSIEVSCRVGVATSEATKLRRFTELMTMATVAMKTSERTKRPVEGIDGESVKARGLITLPKKRTDSQLIFFEPSMEKQAQLHSALVRSLAHGIPRQQLQIHYQPIVDLSSTRRFNPQKSSDRSIQFKTVQFKTVQFKTVGFEALIRWQHPEQGLLQPAQFLPIAGRMGLMLDIDRWVIKTVCRQLSMWRQAHIVVNINLSANHLTQPDLVDYIQRLLRYYPISPHQLNLEITEGELIEDLDKAADTLRQIRAMGLSVSLDDFGSGYSSLSYLDRLPADVLKIDQSFVRRLCAAEGGEDQAVLPSALPSTRTESTQLRAMRPQATQARSAQAKSTQAIVKAILELAAELNIRVVAEGIERVDQLELLKEMHCGYGQGYLFSRPASAQLAETLLQA